jgi:FlaG/FlaF family flagellin (archaellin)
MVLSIALIRVVIYATPGYRLERKRLQGEKLMNKKRYLVIIVIVAVAVLLAILFDTMLANHRPAITGLEAPERVIPMGICQIVCSVSDRDGDELSYNWSASGGNISGTGASVNWTAPDSEGSYNVTVWVTDGRSVEVMKQVTITVRTNEPPTITSLVADADWTLLSSSLNLTCDASDPDGDELSYEWTATGGFISGTGAVVNWTAPEEVGIYYVTVVVKDGHGSTATDSVPISAVTEQPPNIEDLLITKDRYGHCYLRKYSAGYYVGKGQKYDIECIVSDTSGEVSYNWSCDGGEISGEGSLITWTAPNTSTDVTVTVIVSDIAGNMMTKNIVLKVVACSSCTFGC